MLKESGKYKLVGRSKVIDEKAGNQDPAYTSHEKEPIKIVVCHIVTNPGANWPDCSAIGGKLRRKDEIS